MMDLVPGIFERNNVLPLPDLYIERPPKLIGLMLKWQMTSIFDSGCNTREWIKNTPFAASNIKYSCGDISPTIVGEVKKEFPGVVLHDCRADPFPDVDLVLSSDVMIHLNNRDKLRFLKNFANSNAKYLLMTDSSAFVDSPVNVDIEYSNEISFAPVFWQLSPWCFPKPLDTLSDKPSDNRLCLWSREQLTPIIEKL